VASAVVAAGALVALLLPRRRREANGADEAVATPAVA
jgi:hypothetical protein